jgi:hypothetical protein
MTEQLPGTALTTASTLSETAVGELPATAVTHAGPLTKAAHTLSEAATDSSTVVEGDAKPFTLRESIRNSLLRETCANKVPSGNGQDAQQGNVAAAATAEGSVCTKRQTVRAGQDDGKCVSGKVTTTACAGGTQCVALPLVNKAETVSDNFDPSEAGSG